MNNGNTKADINLVKLIERFKSEAKCLAYLEQLRWPDGIKCPRCDSKSVSRIETRDQFDCNDCRYQFSATSKTILHDTHLPLWKWFLAAYMMIEAKKGISANQLKRTLGVSYKTAWYLCHRVRSAMHEAYPMPLKGMIEIDETFVGGKKKGAKGYRGKAVVVGAIQRGGKILLQVAPDRSKPSLQNFVWKNTQSRSDAYITDDYGGYKGIEDENTKHEVLNHSLGEYDRNGLNTNSIENVWSLLKRSIVGSYHKVSVKHLDAYLDELEWRFNNRDNEYLFRDTILKLIGSDKLTYEALTQ
jgi:transposase-like protein